MKSKTKLGPKLKCGHPKFVVIATLSYGFNDKDSAEMMQEHLDQEGFHTSIAVHSLVCEKPKKKILRKRPKKVNNSK